MFKTKEEVIIIQAEAKEPIATRAVFWSHDKGTAKMLFKLRKDGTSQSLAEGTIVPVLLKFNSETAEGGIGRHVYHAVIEDAVNGIVSIILEDNILGYQGRVDGSIYIELPDSRSLDIAGRFTFHIKRSPIDEDVPELEDYYWQGFGEIMEQYHESIAEIKLEAKTTLDSLTVDVNTAQNTVTVLEQSITTANTNLNARIDEINKKIDDNDVFTKAESSANVIDQIGGAESAILKKELLVDGTESTAQRYIKDIPNLALDDPLYQEYGVVPGQPNLLNGTSDEWKEYEFSSADTNRLTPIQISSVGLKVGDTVSLKQEIDNTHGSSAARAWLQFYTDSAWVSQHNGTTVAVGSTGFSTISLVIPAGVTRIIVSSVAQVTAAATVVKSRRQKLIKGPLTAMDEWTPSQADSGLTPINDGMVPFTEPEYETLQSSDGVVRAETLIYGRGAELKFEFPVIDRLVEKYPYAFEGLTTTAEKINTYLDLVKSITLDRTIRGGGINPLTNNAYTYSRTTINKNGSFTALGASNYGATFRTMTDSVISSSYLNTNGQLITKATTSYLDSAGNGALSDGVTPAWVEVKDISLTVELEVNGRTIIESMIAQNHVDNLATQNESETATDNTKTMTPLRTKQLLDSKLLNMVYPIGSIYMSVNSATPATLFGGTWERFSKGRVLVGVDESDTVLATSGKQGGSTNPLTTHTHVTQLTTYRVTSAGSGTVNNLARSTDQGNAATGEFGSVTSSGDNTDHKNWQPFDTVYIWKRTA